MLFFVSGLIILSVAFLVHRHGTRRQGKAEEASTSATARLAQAHELEGLVSLGRALAESLDLNAIRDVLRQHLPQLAGIQETWVLIRTEGIWNDILADSARAPRREIDTRRQRAAAQAVASDTGGRLPRDGVEVEGQICFPLTSGGSTLGALGFATASLTESQRGIFAAAASLVAASIRNAQLLRGARETSLRDSLTGCVNRSHGIETTETELRRARRSHSPMSVIMFDVDHFKDISDRHGHLCCDSVLAAVGHRMNDVLRGSDVKCRYGGEEFLVVLPETSMEGARHVAELLRKKIADNPVAWNGNALSISASFGVTVALANELDTPVVIARADSALYRAKSEGHNCVRVADHSIAV